MAYLVLVVAQLVGLGLILYGIPGLWLQLASLVVYAWWTAFAPITQTELGLLVLLGVAAESIATLAVGPYARTRSADRVAAVAAVLGALGGGGLGWAVPFVGIVFGAALGGLIGAAAGALAPWGRGRHDNDGEPRARTGWRVLALGMRSGAGVAVAALALLLAAD